MQTDKERNGMIPTSEKGNNVKFDLADPFEESPTQTSHDVCILFLVYKIDKLWEN